MFSWPSKSGTGVSKIPEGIASGAFTEEEYQVMLDALGESVWEDGYGEWHYFDYEYSEREWDCLRKFMKWAVDDTKCSNPNT